MTDSMAGMRAKFLDRCKEDLSILCAPVEQAALLTTVHRLAGVAGIFGYHDLGALALRIDTDVRATNQVDQNALSELVEALRALSLDSERRA